LIGHLQRILEYVQNPIRLHGTQYSIKINCRLSYTTNAIALQIHSPKDWQYNN